MWRCLALVSSFLAAKDGQAEHGTATLVLQAFQFAEVPACNGSEMSCSDEQHDRQDITASIKFQRYYNRQTVPKVA